MRIKHWSIKTHTKEHYISTVWLDISGHYETMVFAYGKEHKIDWKDKHVAITKGKQRAVTNHCTAIRLVMDWESHAKNA